MKLVSVGATIEHRPQLAVIRTEVSSVSPTRVTIEWKLSIQPGEEWLAAFHHSSCCSIPARLGVTTAYGSPLVLDDGVIAWSVDESEMGPAVAAGAAMIDRATSIAELLAS
jgi:hypothetical protein